MSYAIQYALSISVAVAIAIIGAINAAGATTLGLQPTALAWLNVIVPGLGILAGILPSVRRPPDASGARDHMD